MRNEVKVNVIKRNGQEVRFDETKIINAIRKANAEVDEINRMNDARIEAVADNVADKVAASTHAVSVEDIQDMVETGIMEMRGYEVAQKYVRYRYRREISRKSNTTDDAILSLINQTNESIKQENSNKNPVINSTQRDYMAGEVSKDLTKRVLLPQDIVRAHEEGIIHFHDADYYAQKEHNCFGANEEFVTDRGIRKFGLCKDGEEVNVLDKDGVWRTATVHEFGQQEMNEVMFQSGRSTKTVVCTANHRWILADGTVTTELAVGMRLYALHDTSELFTVRTVEDAVAFCNGFAIGDGTDTANNRTKIRLCGNKTQYQDIFAKAGWSVNTPESLHGDVEVTTAPARKQDILNGKAWRYMSKEAKIAFFNGYYAADGSKNANSAATADERVLLMIEEISAVAGFHISSIVETVHDTPFKKNAGITYIHFRKAQNPNNLWTVKSIIPHHRGSVTQTAYCVVEPVTHTFTLAGGMVTGNCDLINLEDMLQNGTVISGTMIERPHSFYTACNVTTQIIAQVASNQFGGQSFTLAHLAPFVDVSRKKLTEEVIDERKATGESMDPEIISRIVEKRLDKEIRDGIQTIQYQLITLMTCNGQAPFVTMFMYLDEVPEGQTRDDLARLIQEVLKQRIQGVKNEKGVWITPAFPKLIYVLDEDNIHENSKYYYLTELAAKCTAKRMVPDYISAKVMKENKNGDTYPCMGCVDGREVIVYRVDGRTYLESFERAWNRLMKMFPVLDQADSMNKYMDLDGVEIYDSVKGFVPCRRMIRNIQSKWMQVTLQNGRTIRVTDDHPFETENRGVVLARDLTADDQIRINKKAVMEGTKRFDPELAWLLGVMVCDGCYDHHVSLSIAETGEDEIAERFCMDVARFFELDTNIVHQHRGTKGNYQDIYVVSDGTMRLQNLSSYLDAMFGGRQKAARRLPADFLEWNADARMALLAGIIDADGYTNNNNSYTVIQAGSTNQELALDEMYLAQSLGMYVRMYQNLYRANYRDKVRYRVEFIPTQDLLDSLACSKKKTAVNLKRTNKSAVSDIIVNVTEVQPYEYDNYSYDVTTDSGHFEVSGIYSHNCRSFLTPDTVGMNPDGSHKYYGRFNQGVVTINLVDVACSSEGDMDKFWKIFDERLELCHRALRCRHERLLGTPSDVAPILWQYGALARLKKGETIDKLLYNNYSTLSLGYAGLYEMCMRMLGVSHTDPKGKEFALKVMQHMNDKCAEWRANENISYSLYGTPMESTTYKFAKCLQKRFGIIKDVTDHNYITNSYHVNVREKIDAFTKLGFEAQFQKLSPGGAISYVEVPNMQKNIPAVIAIMQFIYDNIMYAELNTKSDYCEVCGYDGEIKIVEDENGKLVWECPNCGNRDQTKMSVARRTCGYIGTQFWNQGRTQEIKDRVLHVSQSVINN